MKYLFLILFLLLPFKGFSQTQKPSDTLYVKLNSVVIIHPTNSEMDSITKADTTTRLQNAISDYTRHTTHLLSYLYPNKVAFNESQAKYFVLTRKGKKTCILKRKDLPELFAYIFINSQGEYKIEKGVKTDEELISLVKNFVMKKQ